MLGRDLVALLEREGEDVTGCGRGELDITDAAAVRAALRRREPTAVVNCAAWTAVDDAETHEDAALEVNGHAVAGLAAACADHGATLVQVSTDYVFDGASREPYGEADPPAPRTAYGRSKLAGERAVLDMLADGGSGYVVRTAWLYGAHGPNFVRTMMDLERRRPAIDVVDDQHGQPSWTVSVARQIVELVRLEAASGIYHATSSDETTWFGLAREVFRLLGADPARVRATTSEAFPRPAARPTYSVLGHDGWAKAGLEPIGDWRDALRRAFPGLLAAFMASRPERLSDPVLGPEPAIRGPLPPDRGRAGALCRRRSPRTGAGARLAGPPQATAWRHPSGTEEAPGQRASRSLWRDPADQRRVPCRVCRA
jgi:dTDP-4-dehydrorhamnose reductase